MNILHATERHTRVTAGIAFAVNGIISQTSDAAQNLLTVGDTDIVLPPTTNHYFSNKSTKSSGPWRYAPGYGQLCERIILDQKIEAVHIHGAWTHPIFAAHRAAFRLGIPTILTNHGQFTAWALRQPNMIGAVKKRFYLALMTDRLFHRVSLLHAITPLDRESLHRLFPRSRIEVIPNSIDLARLDEGQTPEMVRPANDPYALFVGRLHPVKGLILLIEAFGRAKLPANYRLIIVGPEEDPTYATLVRKAIVESPRASRIELRGPVWDSAEKYALMRGAWVTVIPSHTEVISLVNLEASACLTPTITTPATGLFDWEEGGGMLVQPTISSITEALSISACWSDKERHQRGQASRKLVERRYSTDATGPLWMELYRSLV